MTFSDKLSILMKVQNTTNSRLAKAIAVDASLISRWRSGSRVPANDSPHIPSIAVYFSEQAKMDYQKAALYEVMKAPYNARNMEGSLAEMLMRWLSDSQAHQQQGVNAFLDKLGLFTRQKQNLTVFPSSGSAASGTPLQGEVYYGIRGKQDGVLHFLHTVAAQSKPVELLLYSDESMEWLSKDRAFYMQWGALLTEIIRKGSRIKIIHTVDRDVTEMLAAIDRWLPLYMTGAIEPYYYPKHREHIFRRTLFIAPGIAAMTSATLNGCESLAPNYYSEDKTLIQAMAEEFHAYLALCRPLMQIFTAQNFLSLTALVTEFEAQPGDSIYMSNTLSSVTMPPEFLTELLKKNGIPSETIAQAAAIQSERHQTFLAYIKDNLYREIIRLPSAGEIIEDPPLIEISGFIQGQTLKYTPEDFAGHLRHILRLLNTYSNYAFYIGDRGIPQKHVFLAAKDETGAIVGKIDQASTVFAFNQPDMTYSFYSYMEDSISRIPKEARNKKRITKDLQSLADALRSPQ